MGKPKLKRDKYKSARFGSSKIYNIYCSACNNFMLSYQKDGMGTLKRLYFDRIMDLPGIDIDRISKLQCPQCKKMLAAVYVYQKEQRKAFRLYPGAIFKKLK